MSANLSKNTLITAKDLSILKAFDININSFTHLRDFKDCLFKAVYLKMQDDGIVGDDALDLCYQLYKFFMDLEKIYEKYPYKQGTFIDANVEVQETMIAMAESEVSHA